MPTPCTLDYCLLCQEHHRMTSSCYWCKGCGARGHLRKDCPVKVEPKEEKSELKTKVKDGDDYIESGDIDMSMTKAEPKASEVDDINDIRSVSSETKTSIAEQIEKNKESGIKSEYFENITTTLKTEPIAFHERNNQPYITKVQRQLVVSQCCDDLISPSDLSKRWNISADTVRMWVRKAHKRLPKFYRCALHGGQSKEHCPCAVSKFMR